MSLTIDFCCPLSSEYLPVTRVLMAACTPNFLWDNNKVEDLLAY